MGNPGRACGYRNDARRPRLIHRRGNSGRLIDLGLTGCLAQERFGILQGLGRRALVQTFANEARQVQRTGADHQHPLGRIDGGLRQLPFRVLAVVDFDAGAPALALGGSVQQARTEHTGDHAVGAGRNDG
ncbi:hypothetical protein D9M73_222060 [compost metagenome]